MIALNANDVGIPHILTNDPAYAGARWSHGFDPGQSGFNYEGLIWDPDNAISKPTEEELLEKWNDTYKAQWQQSGQGSPWTELRLKRDRLLTESDWMAVADRTMSDAETAYRQALRDLPANTTDPENPTWPTKP